MRTAVPQAPPPSPAVHGWGRASTLARAGSGPQRTSITAADKIRRTYSQEDIDARQSTYAHRTRVAQGNLARSSSQILQGPSKTLPSPAPSPRVRASTDLYAANHFIRQIGTVPVTTQEPSGDSSKACAYVVHIVSAVGLTAYAEASEKQNPFLPAPKIGGHRPLLASTPRVRGMQTSDMMLKVCGHDPSEGKGKARRTTTNTFCVVFVNGECVGTTDSARGMFPDYVG